MTNKRLTSIVVGWIPDSTRAFRAKNVNRPPKRRWRQGFFLPLLLQLLLLKTLQ